MRVAEKLRLLQNATVDELPSHVAVHVAWRVLPQIVALVEAAEKHGYMEDTFPIVQALAALDEALSPPTGGSP